MRLRAAGVLGGRGQAVKARGNWRDRTLAAPETFERLRKEYLKGQAELSARGRLLVCPACGRSRKPDAATGAVVPCTAGAGEGVARRAA